MTTPLIRRHARLVPLVLALGTTARAQQPAIVRESSVEGIIAYRIPGNGLRVLFSSDPTKPQTLVNVTYLVGSRHEGYGETGMAHLLEHMLFKGTTRHPDIAKDLESHGAQYNGTTSFDRTNYFEVFSAADTTLAWALQMEADRMLDSRVAKVDLDKEFSVVRSEFENGENNPTLVTIKRVLGSAYLFHAYGRLPIGAQSDIENVPIDRLQAFYHRYYQPDNAVLMIAGRFDTTKALALVQQYFVPLPRPSRVMTPTYTVEPTQDGEREVWVRRTGAEQAIVAFYHVPAGSSPEYAAVDVLQHVLTDPPSGRLTRALVDPKKAASVGALPLQLHDPGGLMLIASLRKEDTLAVARVAMLKALEDIVTTSPPTAAEVDRAKTTIASAITLSLNNTAGIGVALSDWIAMGDWRLFFLHRDQVRKVTPADVQRAAAAYLKSSNRTLGFFAPTDNLDRAEIAAAPDVATLVKDYRGEAPAAAGEEFDPSPANIMTRTKQFTTRAGLQTALLAKRTKGESVNASIVLRWGSEESLRGRGDAASTAGDMLMLGTVRHTRQQLTDSLAKLKAQMSVAGTASNVVVNITTTRANLPAALALADEMVRSPSFDSAEFGKMMRDRIASVEAQAKDPTALAIQAARRKMSRYPRGDPRYVGTVDETLADMRALSLADVRKAYANYFGAGAGQIAVVGDFDETAVRAQLDTMFAGWKSPAPYTPMKTVLWETTSAHEEINTPDKPNSMFVAGTTFALSDHDPDYAAMRLADYIMGGGALTSRLTDRIRVKDGLSYIVQSVFGADSREKAGQFLVVAIHAPQNGDKVQQAFLEELARAHKDGFTADEVDKAKTGVLQTAQLTRGQDGGLAGQLVNKMLLGRTMQFDVDFEQRIRATTVEQVNAAFRKYVDADKIVIVRAGDQAKVGQPVPPKP